jgi:hypothetical protein
VGGSDRARLESADHDDRDVHQPLERQRGEVGPLAVKVERRVEVRAGVSDQGERRDGMS